MPELSQPRSGGRPQVRLSFSSVPGKDYGRLFRKLEFKAMINGGYCVRITLSDPNFNLMNTLLEKGYLEKSRSSVLAVQFQILAHESGVFPETATRVQVAYVTSMRAYGKSADIGYIQFIAIDPPSWHLNTGDASGKVYKGKVSQVIRNVVSDYAPGITLDISETIDSESGQWWMMRQDPKTFIGSLIEWSAAITRKRTNYIVSMDGNTLKIKEQADLESRKRAYYRYWSGGQSDTIRNWNFIADNALSLLQTKIITQGLSSISGQYLDKITDKKEEQVFAKDATTSEKRTAFADITQTFTKPPDGGPPNVGWTTLPAVPEIYSAGELGLKYSDYIDGRARNTWLNLVNHLMRMKFQVLGHGEWSDGHGLGIDTIFVNWTSASQSIEPLDRLWFATGWWIVYGFNHVVTRKAWWTDLYCARFDWNASSEAVPKPSATILPAQSIQDDLIA